MSSEWLCTTLGAVTTWASGGTPKIDEPSYWNGEIPWISANSMHATRFSESDRMLTESGLNSGSRLAQKDAVLLLVRGSALHSRVPVGIALRDVAFNQDVKAITAAAGEIRPWYLLYWLMGNERFLLETLVEYTGIGAGKLDTKRLQGLNILLPPLREQDEILRVIKSVDDRIALLRETNTTLEAIAQALFKSWFVDFDPVRAKQEDRTPEGIDEATAALFPDSFEESELGLVPRGWRVGPIGESISVVDFVANGSFASLKENVTLENDPSYALYLRTTDFNSGYAGNFRYVSKSAYDFLSKSSLDGTEVVISNVGDVGTVFRPPTWLGLPMTLGSNAVALKARDHSAFMYLYFSGAKGQHDIQSIVTGSAQLKFNKTNFRSLLIALPEATVSKRFESIAGALLSTIDNNLATAQTLATLRDTLLPRLISGALRLPEAQSQLEEAYS